MLGGKLGTNAVLYKGPTVANLHVITSSGSTLLLLCASKLELTYSNLIGLVRFYQFHLAG